MDKSFSVLAVAACPFPAERGTPVRILRLCEGLSRQGIRVEIVAYHIGDPVDLGDIKIHRTKDDRTYQHTAPGPTLKKLMVLDWRLVRLTVERLKSGNFDVVLAHHAEGLMVARAARALARSKVPIVFDCHTSLEIELPFYMPLVVQPFARLLGRKLDRVLPALADHTTVVTSELRSRIVSRQVLRADRVTVVNNGLEFEFFENFATQRLHSERGQRLVFAGNLASYQGVELMLDAFELVLKKHPKAHLNIVSRDPFDPFEERCRNKDLRHAIDIDCVGFEDVPACLARADVALNPRVNAPGLPLKTLNYLALGLPIVSFAGSGIT